MVDTIRCDLGARLARLAEDLSTQRSAQAQIVVRNVKLSSAMKDLCRTVREAVMQSHEQRNRIARGGSRRRPIGQRSSRPKIAALPPARLRRVMTHIDASLDQRLDVPSLAAVAGLSPGHFAAMFKRATGMPPHQAVTRRRLARAIELLADGRLSIAEIGCQLGFSSHAHFCTTFRRRHGVSPTAWRTLQRGKASDDIRQTQTGYSTNTRNSSADFESHP